MEDVIPSMVDGLRESERVLLFSAFNKAEVEEIEEIEVSQLAKDSYIFRPTKKYLLPYRMSIIVKMAQDFAGTNNINLLLPIGDFGSKYLGGIPDVSRGTDLMIKLNPVARLLFNEADDAVALEFLGGCVACGRLPMWFLPTIPLSLVNGTDCFVSGYRSYVPKYRPLDVIANLKCLLKGKDLKPMIPWFQGFKGHVEACPDDDTKFIVTGAIDNVENETKTVEVIELPVGILAKDYVNLLKDGSIPNKGYLDLSDYSNQSLCLRVSLLDDDFELDTDHLMERLKLTNIISLASMYLIDEKGMTRKYDSPLEVIREFYHYRLPFFEHRKKLLLNDCSRQLEELDNKFQESLIFAGQCIKKLKLMKGQLPTDLKNLFDDFIDQKIGEVNLATISAHFVEEALDSIAALIKEVISFRKSDNPKSGKVHGDQIHLLETVGNWIRKLGSAFQSVGRLQSDKCFFHQKLDDLEHANMSSLWLHDLDQLQEFLAETDYLTLAAEKGMEAVHHQSRGITSLGKKRRRHFTKS